MTSDRKIITRETGKQFKLGYLAWDDLEPAPSKKMLEGCRGCILEDTGSSNCGECSRCYNDMWEAKQ